MADSPFPFRMRKIGAERDAPAAPAKRRKSAHFQKKIAIFLAELRGFAPIMNFQAWYNCMLRQGRWIEQPRVGDYFLQLAEIFLAEFASPKLAQRLHPKKRKPHFLFEIWLDRRRDGDASFCIRAQRIFDPGNVWQIK